MKWLRKLTLSTVLILATFGIGIPASYRVASMIVEYQRPKTLQVVIVTAGENRNGHEVLISGVEAVEYLRNPVVLWAHQYRELPIGRITDLRIVGDQIIATVEFASTARARDVYRLYKQGCLNAWSIGFRPLEWHEGVIVRWELLEVSAVPVPADPDALVIR